ncbi:MAG: hypothetical protein ACR2IS_18565 [Nitrososphaeraceae archaeon]
MSKIGKIAKCSVCGQEKPIFSELMILVEIKEFIVRIVSSTITRRLSVEDAAKYYFIKS